MNYTFLLRVKDTINWNDYYFFFFFFDQQVSFRFFSEKLFLRYFFSHFFFINLKFKFFSHYPHKTLLILKNPKIQPELLRIIRKNLIELHCIHSVWRVQGHVQIQRIQLLFTYIISPSFPQIYFSTSTLSLMESISNFLIISNLSR